MQYLELGQKIPEIKSRSKFIPKNKDTLTWKDLQGLSWIFEENWE